VARYVTAAEVVFTCAYWVLPEHVIRNSRVWIEREGSDQLPQLIQDMFARAEHMLSAATAGIVGHDQVICKYQVVNMGSPLGGDRRAYLVLTMPEPHVAALPFYVAIPLDENIDRIWLLEKCTAPIRGGLVCSMSLTSHSVDAQTPDTSVSTFLRFVDERTSHKNLVDTISVRVLDHLGSWAQTNERVMELMKLSGQLPVRSSDQETDSTGVSTDRSFPETLEEMDARIEELFQHIRALSSEKDEAVKRGAFETAVRLRDEIQLRREEVAALQNCKKKWAGDASSDTPSQRDESRGGNAITRTRRKWWQFWQSG
jgi:hypothetical protein